MATLDELLREAELAHGHLCAGQVLGVRMAMLALQRLGITDPRARVLADGSLNPDRKRLVTFVEIDRCATDAIAVGVLKAARVDLVDDAGLPPLRGDEVAVGHRGLMFKDEGRNKQGL